MASEAYKIKVIPVKRDIEVSSKKFSRKTHKWWGERCQACATKQSWPLADQPCPGNSSKVGVK